MYKEKDLQKEESLLKAAQANREEFDTFYRYFLDHVYRFSYSIVRNKHDAEDITSQTFIEFYKKLDLFEWRGTSIQSWLFGTARNLAYAKLRKPATVEFDEEYHGEELSDVSFVDEVMQKDILEKVDKEMQQLTPEEREIITLRIWEGYSFPEIAEVLKSTEEASRKRFNRTIAKVRDRLKEKRVLSLVALPVLFTAISQTGSVAAYTTPTALSTAAFSSIVTKGIMTTNIFTTLKTFLATKAGIATVAGATAITAVTGGGIYYITQRDDSKPSENTAQVTPTPTTTLGPSITLEPTLTPTPANLNTYTNSTLGITFTYPKALTSYSDPKNVEIGNGTLIDTCITFKGNVKYKEDAGLFALNTPLALCVDDSSTIRKDFPQGGYNWVKNIIERTDKGEFVTAAKGGLKKESDLTTIDGTKVYTYVYTPGEGLPGKIALFLEGNRSYYFIWYKLTPEDITEGQFYDVVKSFSSKIKNVYQDNYITFEMPQGWSANVGNGEYIVPGFQPELKFNGTYTIKSTSPDQKDSYQLDSYVHAGDVQDKGYLYDPKKPLEITIGSGLGSQIDTIQFKEKPTLLTTRFGLAILVSQEKGYVLVGTFDSENRFIASELGSNSFSIGDLILGTKGVGLPDIIYTAFAVNCTSGKYMECGQAIKLFFDTERRLN